MEYLKPIGFALLPQVGGFVGSFITQKNVKTWYDQELIKPKWTPPNSVFVPVWVSLYTAMGYASYLVYRDGGGFDGEASTALTLYGAQILLNWIWTPVLFGAKNLSVSAVIITGLLGINTVITGYYYPINQTASYLMLPYIAWLGLATALNWSFYSMNKKKSD